jgi:hypothetical protein
VKPLLFLDIDGVLCPFGIESGGQPIPGHEYVLWNPRHTEWLHELREKFVLVWGSFWEQDANKVIAPLHDLDALPFVEFSWPDSILDLTKTIKLESIERFAGDLPFAWVDDDLRDDAFTWAKDRDKVVPTLLIRTDPTVGLDEQAMRQLRDFN